MSDYSEDFLVFKSSGKCPRCGSNIQDTKKYFQEDGLELKSPRWHFFWWGTSKMIIGCPHCNHKWTKWDDKYIVKQESSRTAPSTPKDNITPFKVIDITRSEDFMGIESRLIDNSKSGINITREVVVSREWTKSYTIDYEKAMKVGTSIDIGLFPIVNFKPQIEQLVKSTYSISQESRHIHTEKVVLEIPAKVKIRVFFHWKCVWQHGMIRITEANGNVVDVPFKVVIGVTFDQTQVDE